MSDSTATPPDAAAAEYGRVDRVSPLVRRVLAPNPGPFTYTGTGTYIVGSGTVAIVDPGPNDPDHIAALLAAVDGETVSHIVVTHTHRDHSPITRPPRSPSRPRPGHGSSAAHVSSSTITVPAPMPVSIRPMRPTQFSLMASGSPAPVGR